jgi:hypothetical protein
MKVITVIELFSMVAKRGSTFAAFMMEVDPSKDMRKTGNRFHGNIFKRSNIVANVGYNRVNKLTRIECKNAAKILGKKWKDLYADRVALGKMVEVGERQWGIKVPNLPIVTHKKNTYLQVSVESAKKPTFHWNDGTKLTSAEVAEMKTFCREKPAETIIHRDYGIAGVRRANIAGKRYRIEHTPEMLATVNEMANAEMATA